MRDNKKTDILAAALEHFSRCGYSAASMEHIAGDAGVSKPAIYYHFRDKAALYEAVLCGQFSRLRKDISARTKKEKNAIDKLRVYITTFGSFLIDNPYFSAIFSREIASGGATLPAPCTGEIAHTLRTLSAILKEGNNDGIFREEKAFMIQMMIVTPLAAYHTTQHLRERIAENFSNDESIPETNFNSIVNSLSDKIIKALTC